MITNEKNALILLGLLKAHGIRKVVVSPGSTNIPVSGSVQNDPFFQVFSSVDERSAAYIACGLAERTGEPVVISCTGATASRNYLPGLTEAYYRKLPVIAVTSFNGNENIGNLVPQNIDRTQLPRDAALISVQLPFVKDEKDEWFCNLLVNRAIVKSTRDGGPVHINLPSSYTGVFESGEIPKQRIIRFFEDVNELPAVNGKNIAIFIGSNPAMSKTQIEKIESFCEGRNAVVLCDHTSGYSGNYKVSGALVCANLSALNHIWKSLVPDLVFHIGEVSGDYYTSRVLREAKEVWRVASDGELRDTGRKMSLLFNGSVESFFGGFSAEKVDNCYFKAWSATDISLRENIPELPFSNMLIAKKLSQRIKKNSVVYLGILNSLRCWNFFNVEKGVDLSCNVGGFGIDGCLSTAIGSALAVPEVPHYIVLGDLAFFYDINSLANRHLPNNLTIVLINNGCGVEFNNSTHIASKLNFDPNDFIAAGGHFNAGPDNESSILPKSDRRKISLAKAWCETLGFEYVSISQVKELDDCLDVLISERKGKNRIFECFTDVVDESVALEKMISIQRSGLEKIAFKAKDILPSGVARKARGVVLNALGRKK